MKISLYDAIYLQSVVQIPQMIKQLNLHPTPRIALFVGWLVGPSPKNIASYIANAYTMRTSSQMYDAVKMKMIIIILERCDHHHDDHHHLCTMRSS